MRKPVFFAIAACSSMFLRIPARIAFEEKLSLLVGDTGQYGEVAGYVGGASAVVGATAIVYYLMHSDVEQPDGSTQRDIDYKGALDPRKNKWVWLHFLMSLPIMAAVIETESRLPLKLTGSIPRIAMDIIITKNLIHLMVDDNRRFARAWRSNGWLTLKAVTLLMIAAPLWLGLGVGTAETAKVAFKFKKEALYTFFVVLGSLGGLQFGSSI